MFRSKKTPFFALCIGLLMCSTMQGMISRLFGGGSGKKRIAKVKEDNGIKRDFFDDLFFDRKTPLEEFLEELQGDAKRVLGDFSKSEKKEHKEYVRGLEKFFHPAIPYGLLPALKYLSESEDNELAQQEKKRLIKVWEDKKKQL